MVQVRTDAVLFLNQRGNVYDIITITPFKYTYFDRQQIQTSGGWACTAQMTAPAVYIHDHRKANSEFQESPGGTRLEEKYRTLPHWST